VYVLVRHGHAGAKKLWEGDDADRPLSGRGRQQAEGLVASLREAGPTRLVSSPFLRCRQTLEPLAQQLSLPLATWDLLRPDADARRLDRWLADTRLQGAVLSTHGETLHALFDLWAGSRAVVRIGHGATTTGSTQKGAAWIVTTDEEHTWARYVRPLHIGPEALACS
jgi:phosphohistidine phosphatase SixA